VRRWEAKKVNAPGGNVLAHLAGANDEAFRSQFVEQFFVDQMDLTQVWLGGVPRNPRAVFHRLAHVSVTIDAEALQQTNAHGIGLAEVVACEG
jgi:hypothetical protein